MQSAHRRISIAIVFLALLITGCSLPVTGALPTPAPGDYAGTIAAIQTISVQTATAQGFGAGATPLSPATLPPAATGTLQSPVVVSDTLCWRGPGADYEVISAIKAGTAVSMLGRGAIAGWYILRNPIYGDPCWLQAGDLQIPAGYDVSTLPLFNPPWTATPTASVTPLVSSTPSSTATPPPPTPGLTATP